MKFHQNRPNAVYIKCSDRQTQTHTQMHIQALSPVLTCSVISNEITEYKQNNGHTRTATLATDKNNNTPPRDVEKEGKMMQRPPVSLFLGDQWNETRINQGPIDLRGHSDRRGHHISHGPHRPSELVKTKIALYRKQTSQTGKKQRLTKDKTRTRKSLRQNSL